MPAAHRLYYQLFGNLKKKGEWWIAHCPPLDLTTQGRTQEEARKNLVEASELFVISCLERGTFEMALRELGWSIQGAQAVQMVSRPVRPRGSFPINIRVPYARLARSECRV